MTVKQPQAGEYWKHAKSEDRVYFIGHTPGGEMVFQCEGDGVETGDLDWSDWQHLPDCDSFEWHPEVWPDPGEGWELLPEGTSTQDGDEWYRDGVWIMTASAGMKVASGIYRRKIQQPAEVFPQYWTTDDVQNTDDESCVAFVIRSGPAEFGDWYAVQINGRETYLAGCKWNPEGRTQLTKEQAEALLDKKEPEICSMCGLSPVVEGTAGCRDCTEFALDAVKAQRDDSYKSLEGTKVGTVKITPVEGPDDWVEIDKTKYPLHIPRSKCDKVIMHTESVEVAGGRSFVHDGCNAISHVTWKNYKFVCRRKDLPSLPSKTIDVSPGEGWRWVENNEPWQEGDDCLICDGKYAHTHNCQCWRRRVEPSPNRIPVRLWVHKECRNDDRYNVFAKVSPPDHTELFLEIHSDGDGGWYVESGEVQS